MSLVVSDTSPLRALHHVGLVEVLRRLYGTVLVPPAVAAELVKPPAPFPGIDVRTFPFVVIRAPADAGRVQQLLSVLDAGEAEAIEVRPATLLIDEFAGRSVAAAAGVPLIGVLGILARAKTEGLIGAIRPLLDRLRSELKFRVSNQLYDQYLRSVSE
jgi:predicted nucleic acid-binding protein